MKVFIVQAPNSIPRPLVRTNQWFIVLSVLVAWIATEHWVLLLPLIAGMMGLFFNFNPVMRLAKSFLRNPPSSYIPEDRDQQQFNQWIAVGCLLISILGFWFHWSIVAYAFSGLVLISAFIAICGFCIGCFIRFQLLRYRQRRNGH